MALFHECRQQTNEQGESNASFKLQAYQSLAVTGKLEALETGPGAGLAILVPFKLTSSRLSRFRGAISQTPSAKLMKRETQLLACRRTSSLNRNTGDISREIRDIENRAKLITRLLG
jgi:hypothetical protein